MKKRWYIIGILALTVLFAGCNTRQMSLTFAHDVDEDFNLIDEGSTYDEFEIFYFVFQTSQPINQHTIKVTLYKVTARGESVFERTEIDVHPDWTMFAHPLMLMRGDYKLAIDLANGKRVEQEVTIR